MTDPAAVEGEESIIQGYLAPLAAGMPGALGLKDDCALIAPAPGHELVLKTDAIAEGVHFLHDDPPADIGWKALAVNVSDLAAKGARPVGYLMSLSFPQAPTRDWMAAFAAGLDAAQRAFGIGLLGGDTDRRPGPITITPMVIGEVPAGRMIRRGAACPGDAVFVSGTLGEASLGLALARGDETTRSWPLDDAARHALVSRFRRPQPRIALRQALQQHARAAMDVSDGLMKDLDRMCRASSTGAEVEYARLPLSSAFASVRTADPEAAGASLFAGDDYEILCAVPSDRADAFQHAAAGAGVPVTRIGRMTAGAGVTLLDTAGHAIDVPRSGWDHF